MKKMMLALLSAFVTASAFADAPAAAPAQPGTGAMLVPIVAMFAFMYFLMIRPQQKRMKEQATMLGALKEGDEVLTASGILGKVKSITDRVVTLEIDKNVNLNILKSQVTQVLKNGLPEKLA